MSAPPETPWSTLPLSFLSEGDWSVGQGPNAPDRRLFRLLLWKWRQSKLGRPSLLEVGVGSGIDVQALADEGLLERVAYRGYDFTPEFVTHMRQQLPELDFRHRDVMDIGEADAAGFVWCRHLLEHVEDGYRALENLWNATEDVLAVSWFIRPTWNEHEVETNVVRDKVVPDQGFIHNTFSARRMIEFVNDLGASLYRFDFDHHSTKASVWLLGRQPRHYLVETAHRFFASAEFLRSVLSPPQVADEADAWMREIVSETTSVLGNVVGEAMSEAGIISQSTLADARRTTTRANAVKFRRWPLERHERLVLWGFTKSLDSMRHIFRHYRKAAGAFGLPVVQLPDQAESRDALRAGDIVLGVDVEGRELRSVKGAHFVLHNFDASHPVWLDIEDHQFLRLQVYTNEAENYGVMWDPVRRFDAEARTLFQPWGTDMLVEEFMEPVFNPDSTEAAFVGAIWDDDGLGNHETIELLEEELRARGLGLHWLTQVSDDEHVEAIRTRRLAPAFAGAWQVTHDYLPCRVFKNVSYGQLAMTNVPKFRELLVGCQFSSHLIRDQLDEALALSEQEWRDLIIAQQQIVARYTYREGLMSIGRALEEGK